MTTAESSFPKAVLFDLDGTLLDSAADFLFTVNQMREARDLAPITLDVLRPFVSRGARAMLGAAFADVAQEVREAWLPEFLGIYQGQIGQHGRTFPGIEPLLAALEASGTVWGIVTNKPEYLAREIVPQLGWERRSAVLVGGDTFPVKKPHPLPLLMAAERIGVAANQCVYVGDDQRDIVAARAAGMRSVAVLWGYRSADDDPADWGADVLVTAPECLLDAAAWPA